jgi:LAS superfamily LD-carboxypeptidase LdcB
LARVLSGQQLTGLDDSHLVVVPGGHRLQDEVSQAFAALQADAREAGFELAIASSFRSFARQLAIWNGKASGARPVHDDRGGAVAMAQLTPADQLHAILRYSALPGTSRHHWGTDLDVYDAAAVSPGYQVQLSPQEVAAGGVFDPLHCWLDARMAGGQPRGFYRPYARDRGGVAPERWHLSYAALSTGCAAHLTADLLESCWHCDEVGEGLLLYDEIEVQLPQIMQRYVSVGGGWCPQQ